MPAAYVPKFFQSIPTTHLIFRWLLSVVNFSGARDREIGGLLTLALKSLPSFLYEHLYRARRDDLIVIEPFIGTYTNIDIRFNLRL